MSYILEALKKAQAERQLGNTPTIHASQATHLPLPAARRSPLLLGIAVGVLALGLLATLTWRHLEQEQQEQERLAVAAPGTVVEIIPDPPAATDPPAPASAMNGAGSGAASAAPAPGVPASRPQPAAWNPATATQPAAAATPAPRSDIDPAPPVRAREPASVAQQQASKLPAVHDTPARATAPVEPARLPAPALAPAAPAPDPAGLDDDYVRTLAELPEAVRRELPKVVFGGYMYSPNPADRLILVDKILRSEGDEVAPGLKLEKLLPKSAVLKYKGYRYRVLL